MNCTVCKHELDNDSMACKLLIGPLSDIDIGIYNRESQINGTIFCRPTCAVKFLVGLESGIQNYSKFKESTGRDGPTIAFKIERDSEPGSDKIPRGTGFWESP